MKRETIIAFQDLLEDMADNGPDISDPNNNVKVPYYYDGTDHRFFKVGS